MPFGRTSQDLQMNLISFLAIHETSNVENNLFYQNGSKLNIICSRKVHKNSDEFAEEIGLSTYSLIRSHKFSETQNSFFKSDLAIRSTEHLCLSSRHFTLSHHLFRLLLPIKHEVSKIHTPQSQFWNFRTSWQKPSPRPRGEEPYTCLITEVAYMYI